METKNLLPENYAAQCVKNWSKKESEFNSLFCNKYELFEPCHTNMYVNR